MNLKKVKKAIDQLKEDLDGALVATDIYPSNSGISIAGYNEQPKATALFDRVTNYIQQSLKNAGFPTLNDYYMIEAKNDNLVVVLHFEEEGYQQGILIDKSKVNYGILLNIAIPNALKSFREAYAE